MITADLLSDGIRVQVPFCKVVFGESPNQYVFGVFQQSSTTKRDNQGVYRVQNIQYPNYIQSLRVEKINGQVNTYTLSMKYALTQFNDPNFIDKVLSSVSNTRKITFSYGDLNAPAFVYRNEEAIITNVQQQIDLPSASISYTITAVSSSNLTKVGAFNFQARKAKPSDIIKEMLRNNAKYGLLDIFTGMRNMNLVEQRGLIASNDIVVNLLAKRNISVLEYLQYLVKSMKSSANNQDIYVFKVVDSVDEIFNGPYFKVINSTDASSSIDCYSLDIGFDYKTNNAITQFNIDNNEAYSIYYDYSKKLTTDEYVQRIDDSGTLSSVYAPIISSDNTQGITQPEDENWWKNVTQYPLSATLTIRGLLRPAILMSKIDIGCFFYGKLYAGGTGSYIVTQQTDSIDTQGFYTTLKLVRVGSSERYPNQSIQ